MRRILVREDSAGVAQLLKTALAPLGSVDIAVSWAEAEAFAARPTHALFILDPMGPHDAKPGVDFILSLRREGDTRPILITASSHHLDVPAQCLNAGADGFCPKPYRPLSHIVALASRLLSRSSSTEAAPRRTDGILLPNTVFPFAGAHIRPDLTITFPDATSTTLSPLDAGILFTFYRHAGTTIRRTDLLRVVWGPLADPSSNTINSHLSRLRSKFASHGIDLKRHVQSRSRFGWFVSPTTLLPIPTAALKAAAPPCFNIASVKIQGRMAQFPNGTSTRLTAKESALLEFFATNAGRSYTHQDISLALWGQERTNSLPVYLQRLKRIFTTHHVPFSRVLIAQPEGFWLAPGPSPSRRGASK
jgi:two-component system OmpR family response regulator